MQETGPLRSPTRTIQQRIGFVLALSACLMSLVLLIRYLNDSPIKDLTRDPVTIAELPAYTGFLSQVGLFFWAATAAICWFSTWTLRHTAKQERLRSFLMIAGALTLYFGIDDAFLIHEEVLPALGVPQTLVVGSYALVVAVFLVRFFALIVATDYAVLVFALLCFGMSASLDVLHPPFLHRYFFEDGAKLTGLIAWLVYFSSLGRNAVALALGPGSHATD